MSRNLSSVLLSSILSILLGGQALAVNECQKAHAHNKRLGAEIIDTRVQSAVAWVIRASAFRSPVFLCDLRVPYINATVSHVRSFYAVGLTKTLIERTTDMELRAIIGQELAHVALGHRRITFELTHHRTANLEIAADGLAARWCGKEAMLGVLVKLREDAERIDSDLLRTRATTELDARITALRSP